MVREYRTEDKDEIIKIISQGIVINEQDIIDYFTEGNMKIF